MSTPTQFQELESLVSVNFPRKINYGEFVKMFEFIDRVSFPCSVEYGVEFSGRIGQRDESGHILTHHKHIAKGIHGTVFYENGEHRLEKADFVVATDNDYDDECLTKTRLSSLRFDAAGCNSISELERMKSTSVKVMRRVKDGIDVYFNLQKLPNLEPKGS